MFEELQPYASNDNPKNVRNGALSQLLNASNAISENPEGGRAGIAGVIVARDEELNIVRCLEALKPHVAETIVIDMASTDRTVELARPLASKILSHPIVPVMDVARHAALAESKYDWFWFVDADEFIPYQVGQSIAELVRNRGDEFEALQYPFATFFCKQWMKHCGWWPGYTVPRVLKRGHFRFSDQLHMGVYVDGRLLKLGPSFAVPHHSYRSVDHWISKFNRYTSTEALQLAQRDIHWNWRAALRAMVHDLWEHYELHDARKDGNHGWILTWLMSQYRWMSFAKLIDHFPDDAQYGERTSVPASLDEVIDGMQEELSALRARRPQLPLGVVIATSLSGNKDETAEATALAELIAHGTRDIAFRTGQSLDCAIDHPRDESALLRALCRTKRPKFSATITVGPTCFAKTDPFASLNIFRPTVLDVPLSAEVISNLKTFDEIWARDAADLSVLRREWVPPEKLRLVPNVLDEESPAGVADARIIEDAIAAAESRFAIDSVPSVLPTQLRVELEGEFFSFHSFANVNEHLALEFQSRPDVAVSLRRRHHVPAYDQDSYRASRLRPLFGREFECGPQVTIRHAFPPNWEKPETGKWIHVQTWEYGRLPTDWVAPLRDRVDEAWVPSEYVRRVYEQSGIPPEKIQVIPWGVNADVFSPAAPPLQLPTAKTFAFLFVGGVVERKGADIAVQAYQQEFSADEDVCLVIKDVGSQTFYRNSPAREKLLASMHNPEYPQIVYLDQTLSDGQMASLYTACKCLVAPYRGEGFALPVLESMACGIPPIVPSGGPTDDYADKDCAIVLPHEEVEIPVDWDLCGPATQLQVTVKDVRHAMRSAFANREQLARMGAAASRRVLTNFTWQSSTDRMVERLKAITIDTNAPLRDRTLEELDQRLDSMPPRESSLSAVVIMDGDEPTLGTCTARLAPFVAELIAINFGASNRSVAIAKEYGARVYEGSQFATPIDAFGTARKVAMSPWLLFVNSTELLRHDGITDIVSRLRDTPSNVPALALQVRSETGSNLSAKDCAPLRLFRREANFAFTDECMNDLLPRLTRTRPWLVESNLT